MNHRPWRVLPHDPIVELEENLWIVDGDLPGRAPMRRRAHFVRLDDGRLVVHSCICLDEPAMAKLDAWGELAFIVVPNRMHRLDAYAFKHRYPKAKVIAPDPCRAQVATVVQVDDSLDALHMLGGLTVCGARGWRDAEPIFTVHSKRGQSLLFADVIFNVKAERGLAGLVLRRLGYVGGIQVTPIARLLQVTYKKALATQLLLLADTPNLLRLVPCHGDIVDVGAAAALRGAAMRLWPQVTSHTAEPA